MARYQYIYEQCGYDPVTREQQVRVSFKFDDGSWMKHAFVYDWRIWCRAAAGVTSTLAPPCIFH